MRFEHTWDGNLATKSPVFCIFAPKHAFRANFATPVTRHAWLTLALSLFGSCSQRYRARCSVLVSSPVRLSMMLLRGNCPPMRMPLVPVA